MNEQNKTVAQPLTGLRVIEFTHMVMGPTCGMVLADPVSYTHLTLPTNREV